MSAPQHPTEPAGPVSEATSGAVLSPVPADAGVPAQPDLPDPDADGADATVEPVDVAEDDEGEDGADDLLVREGDVAGDYLERLLDILDVDGDIDLDVEGDRDAVAIVGGELADLVGADGAVLEALQELTRLAVAQATGVRSRLMLDISGFRARRRADLTSLAAETARRVAGSGQPERLLAMDPFDRQGVHHVVAR